MVFKQRHRTKKACAAMLSCAMAAALAGSFPQTVIDVQAAQTQWKFDFGANGTASGYTQVTASTGYSSSQGFGFANTSQVKDVNAAGSGELSDAVQFTSTSTNNTFNVDLPNGLYEMTVKLGNTARASVWAEGVLQIINMTGNNATDTIQIPVTDGQLNLMVTEGKANTAFTLSALELTKLSDDPTMEQTIWVCGDSTVCNYYPLSSSKQAGWAQLLGNYVDTDNFQIRNMAASGQYAKGFVDAGQFAPIEKYGKAGDYYIISIGINDTNYSNQTEYEQVVTDMTQKAKARGMEVILVKQQGRADDISRSKLLEGRWFGGVLDSIGQAENVQVVDLFTSSQNYWLSIGQDAVYDLFMEGDTLHPNRAGASKLAELVAKEIAFNVVDSGQNSGNTGSSNSSYIEKNISSSPTIYMIGDSTMCNYKESAYPQAGWGQLLGEYFQDNVTIDNRARAGRSSKMFINEGTWDTVYNLLQPGDYVFVSFGINDGNYNNADRYAPVSDGSFQNYMRTFVNGALAKGATPVLFTTVLGLGSYQNGKFMNSYSEYCQATKDIAAEYGLPCIDLNSLMVNHYNSVGYDTAYTYHMISATEGGTDKTHFTEAGATVVAELAADALMNTNLYLGTMVLGAEQDFSSSYILGDVNHDGVIDAFDLCQMRKAFADNSINSASNPEYDVTGDGAFNASDIRTIQDYLLGRIDKFAENPNRYLAVNASVNSGVSETTNAGSSTGTYINLDNQIGSSISWTVNVPEDGNYKLTFHNANGGTADRPMRLSLSCSEDTWRVSFPTTGSWTTWSDSSVVVPLTKGTQTVTLTSLTADGGPNLDYLQLEKVNTEATAPEVKVPEGAKQVEALDRGLIAMKSGNGMFVSWRYLGTDNATTSFKLYRDGNLIYTSNQDAPTCYQDNGGSTSSVYTLETVNNGSVTETSGMTASSANNYLDVPLTPPADLTMPDGTTCSYHANDCSPADLDGDGEYELVIKWDPSNSKDNSQNGYTGNVYLEGVELDGTSLWKIDLGVNIRAGAHYTQFMVYDFDSDGYAEIVCKTGDGTKDAKGNVVGDANADYRTSAGRILSGPEYLTLFDGRNGTILDTIDYEPGRGDSSKWQSVWGDTYGNRMDRFLACVAYLDGTTPSVVMCRGYYTRAVLVAYDVMDKQLVKRWTFDSNDGGTDKNGKPNSDYRGQGAHSIAVADVDQDGFDEIVYGAACIDHDGKGLYSTKLGHGDALHVGDFLPNRPGLEIFMPHEETFGSSLRDAATGEIILRVNGTGDTGRGIAGNFIGNANGAVFTCSSDAILYDGNGNNVGSWSDITKWGMNSEVWFTGTLERAVMDRNCVDQYGVGRVLTGSGIATNNSTKNNACLTADILGDWREEIIWRADDSSYLRIYSTTCSTDYRIFTLMHDVQYREQIATQNVSYNQPPNPSFYLGTGFALPELPNVYAVSGQ